MAFESLSDKLSAAFKKLRSKGKLSESDIKDAMREVKLALLEADVNYKVVKGLYQDRQRTGCRRTGARKPDPCPAGRQDRQRRTDRADGRRKRPD